MPSSKKPILAILIILFFLSVSNAPAYYREEIFNGGVYGNTTANAKYKNISVDLSSDQSTIMARIPGGPEFVIRNNSCESRDYWVVCFDGLEFGFFNSSLASKGQTYTAVDKAKIRVYAEVAQVVFAKTVETTTLDAGKTTAVTFTIKNQGARPAENILFSNFYKDSGIEIVSADGCAITNGNNISWSGRLGLEQEKKCEIEIKAMKEGIFYDQTVISYFNGEGISSFIEQPPTAIKINQPSANFKDSIKSNALIGEIISYNISINNSGKEFNMLVSPLNILLDEGFEVAGKSGELSFKNDGSGENKSYITWTGNVNKLEPYSLLLNLRAIRSGKHTITAVMNYNDAGENLIYRKTNTISNRIELPYILIINKSNGTEINLENPTSFTFKDINFSIDVINPADGGKKPYFTTRKIMGPFTSIEGRKVQTDNLSSNALDINARAVFSTQFGEEFAVQKKLRIGTFVPTQEQEQKQNPEQIEQSAPSIPAASEDAKETSKEQETPITKISEEKQLTAGKTAAAIPFAVLIIIVILLVSILRNLERQRD